MSISASALRKATESQLIALHERYHRLSGGAIGETRSRYWDAHALIREEMAARGLKHSPKSWLDSPLGTPAPPVKPTIVISEYLCATGSLVDPEATHCPAIEMLVRDTFDRGWEALISERYRRDVGSPPLYFSYSPLGPNSIYVPLADLVMVEQTTQVQALPITPSLTLTSLSIPGSGTIVSGTLYLHESFGEYVDALSGQCRRLGVKRVRCVTKDDIPYGTPLRLALVPRATLKASNPLSEAQIADNELAALEPYRAIAGHELKIKVLGRRRIDDGRWLYRGSIRLKSGRLQPIETRQQFEGSDEPGWEMASSRPQRGYVLGTTQPTDERIAVGAIVRVRPTYLTEWSDKGVHYGWLDACVLGIDPDSRQPDSQDVVARIAEATEPLWRGEPMTETLSEDIDIEQPPPEGEYQCALQRHINGVMTQKDLAAARTAIIEAADESERARLWSEAGFEQCLLPLQEIANHVQSTLAGAAEFLDRHLEKRAPQHIDWEQVVLRGDAHTDLRIDSPDGDLVSWTLLTPGIALQRVSDGQLFYGKDRLAAQLDEATPMDDRTIRGIPHSPKPRAYLSLVTRALRRVEQAPGAIGATEQAAGIYELIASGRCEYSEQREDYHGYIMKFAGHKALSGRWDAARLADRWLFSRSVALPTELKTEE